MKFRAGYQWILLILVLVTTGCTKTIRMSSDADCGQGYFASDNGDCITWPSGSEIVWGLDSSVTAHMSPALQNEIFAAFDVWAEELVDLVFVYDPNLTSSDQKSSDGKNVIYFIPSGWDQGEEAQATTRIFADRTTMKEGDIFLNGENYQFSVENHGSKVHLRSLMVHEIGHLLGLVHNFDEYHSVMYDKLGYGQVRVNLMEVDLSRLDFAYMLSAL